MSARAKAVAPPPRTHRSSTPGSAIEAQLRAFDEGQVDEDQPVDTLLPDAFTARADTALIDPDSATAARRIVDDRLAGRSSIEEVILELYHAPISYHAASWAAVTLFGNEKELAAVARHAPLVARRLLRWNHRTLDRAFPYVVLGSVAHRSGARAGTANHQIRFAVGIDAHGHREPLGTEVDGENTSDAWRRFLVGLSHRGLYGVAFVAVPPADDIENALRTVFPTASVQLQVGPVVNELQWLVAADLLPYATLETRAVHKAATPGAARKRVCTLLSTPGLATAPEHLERLRRLLLGTLTYFEHPRAHWRHLRSDRLVREVRRAFKQHTWAVSTPAHPGLVELLALARLRSMTETVWAGRYLAPATAAEPRGPGPVGTEARSLLGACP